MEMKIGAKHSEETKLKMSKSHSGDKHHFYGKHHKEETKLKISMKKKDKKLSEEHKRKISEGNKGKKFSDATKRLMSITNKRNHTEETKKKISITKALNRESYATWKGGISCEPYCDVWLDKEFKEYIKERDNYECQNPDCWRNVNRLVIHHIDYVKKNCEPNNLITLCNSCNSRANRNREYWQELYRGIIQIQYGEKWK